MKNIFPFLIVFVILLSCSDSKLIENWKNPDIDTFKAQKVLVLALSNDVNNREIFESQLVEDLKSKGVNAVVSDDFFGNHFTIRPYTELELAAQERLLLLEGYDAILVSKVVGAEDKVTLVQGYRNFNRTFEQFGEDYYSNQDLYTQHNGAESYKVYHAQSTLYFICPEKERQVIWRASIDVTQVDSSKKAINDYIKMLVWALEEQQLLILKP